MNKNTVIQQIRETAEPFTSYLRQLYDTGKFDQDFNEQWKVRDVLAHVLWYEEEIAMMVEDESIKQSSHIWDHELHERNRLVHEEMQGIPPDELLQRHEAVVEQIIATVSELTDSHMQDPGKFEGMPKEWKPWQIIGGSTFFHYTDHLRRLQEFMEES